MRSIGPQAGALIAIGITNFSITPAAIGPVKAMVRSLDSGAARARMEKLLAKPPKDMRKTLHDWAKRHRVALGCRSGLLVDRGPNGPENAVGFPNFVAPGGNQWTMLNWSMKARFQCRSASACARPARRQG